MQMLHPSRGSIQQYLQEISDPDRYRPESCPQCQARCPLRAHGFYYRTLVNMEFDGAIRVRRYLCCLCGCWRASENAVFGSRAGLAGSHSLRLDRWRVR